jgi:hypothetical protein
MVNTVHYLNIGSTSRYVKFHKQTLSFYLFYSGQENETF